MDLHEPPQHGNVHNNDVIASERQTVQPSAGFRNTGARQSSSERHAVEVSSNTESRGRRNQRQPEEIARSTRSGGNRNQQQTEERASSTRSRGRRNQQQPEETDSSTSSRGRRNQQQPEEAASSTSSRRRRNQQQPEETGSSTSSRGRRNQQQPEETASSTRSGGRRNQQEPEETDRRTNSRGRRNQQQPEETDSRANSRVRRNQQQPEDTVSSTNTRGSRREHQRIVDYSSNLSAIYESEYSANTNDQYDEDSRSLPEMLDTAHDDNLYRNDSMGSSSDRPSRRSWWYEAVRLLKICSALSFAALLVFPSPQSELFGTQIIFNLGNEYFIFLPVLFLLLLFLSNLYNAISPQLDVFTFTYKDVMLISVFTFLFRIITGLKYHMEVLENDYESLLLEGMGLRTLDRVYSYLLVLQALLIWINKVLPVVQEDIKVFVLHSAVNEFGWIELMITTAFCYNVCKSEDSFCYSERWLTKPIRILQINHILLPLMYAMLLYTLIERFRFRAIQLSDDQIHQDFDNEVYFGSLSRFDKLITVFIFILPFIFLLDSNYLPVSGAMFHHKIHYHVERAKYEYDWFQEKTNVTMSTIFMGNSLLTKLDDLPKEVPVSHPVLDVMNDVRNILNIWIESLETLDISIMIFDRQKKMALIKEWIGQLREQNTAIETWLFCPLQ